jgi:hypothetical protein
LRNAWSREPQWAPAACLFSRRFKRLFKGLLPSKALLPRGLSKLREWRRFTHGKPARRNALRCGTGKPPIEQNSPNQSARRVFKEPLNKSPLARRGFAGWDARKATTRMVRPRRAVSSEGRCDPVAGCKPPNRFFARSRHPRRCPIPRFAGPVGPRSGGVPFARSLTRQTARKATSHRGCGNIGRSWRCAPRHRSPGYDQRRAPYDHPDLNSSALSEDLFSGSFNISSLARPRLCASRRYALHYRHYRL